MNIIAGKVANPAVAEAITRCRTLADAVFAESAMGSDQFSRAMSQYDAAVSALEQLLSRDLHEPLRGDDAVYTRLCQPSAAGTVRGELLAGASTGASVTDLVRQVEGILGAADAYAAGLRRLVGGLGAGEWLILWNTSEERNNEIIQAVRPSVS
ncbi:MAG TPA: hypothetical protein VD902_02275 [Symbiobacteriaceae bacterium]|nr:hypothetical protein [Symbiobacteriaceae bacterium]